MKNVKLQEHLAKYESDHRSQEDNSKYIPKRNYKKTELIANTLKRKRKIARSKALWDSINALMKQDTTFMINQREQIKANQERRKKKYGFNIISEALKKFR